MFDALRALPPGDVPAVRVRAVSDLTWTDGVNTFTHAKAGDEGTLFARTAAGFLVRFDSGVRQVFCSVVEDEIIVA